MESSSVSTSILKCELWDVVLENDHNGVRWENSHHLCNDWSEAFIMDVMSAPVLKIPWKLSICRCQMISNYYRIIYIVIYII